MTTTSNGSGVTALGGTSPTNDAAPDIEVQTPFMASVTITGTTPLLFHRWSAGQGKEHTRSPWLGTAWPVTLAAMAVAVWWWRHD